jgi:hypothetical protein
MLPLIPFDPTNSSVSMFDQHTLHAFALIKKILLISTINSLVGIKNLTLLLSASTITGGTLF